MFHVQLIYPGIYIYSGNHSRFWSFTPFTQNLHWVWMGRELLRWLVALMWLHRVMHFMTRLGTSEFPERISERATADTAGLFPMVKRLAWMLMWHGFILHIMYVFICFFIISILKFQRASSQICDTTRSGSVTSTSPADIKLDIKCIDVPLTPRRWSVETAQTESDSFRPDLRWNKIKTWSDSLDQGEQRPKAGCWSFSAHFLKNLQNINFLQSKRCHRITSISLSAFSILFLLLPCHSLRLHSSLVQHIPRLRAPNPLGLLYYVDQLHPINGFVVVCWSISIQCANLITISDSTSESKATVAAAVHAATVEAIDEKYLPCRKRQVQSFTMSGCGTDCAYCNMG